MSDEGEKEKKGRISFIIEQKQVLETVGKWFDSKMIKYNDRMFSDYFQYVKAKILSEENINHYLKLRVDELIFKLLSVYHNKHKEQYEEVIEEEEELVPEWFLTERYTEIEEMFSSKFLSYSFSDVDTEYDSSTKAFTVTLYVDKEIDRQSYDVLMKDIKTYLDNRITLLQFNEGKIIEPKKLEIRFSLDW
ncbi:MAG: hypothetical protein ACTSUR_02695 [Candidatus Heimdallarchaeaceae archaeon]